MTSTLTTISANKRPRPTSQVFDGSNNNVFIHSIEKCKSKYFHFGLALFLRTAILSLDLSAVGTATLRHFIGLSLAMLYIRFTRRFPIIVRSAEGFSNKCTTWRNLCSCFGQSQPFSQVYSLKEGFRSGRYAHIMV